MNRAGEALRAVVHSADLRRAQTGFAAFNVAEQAVWIAMLVFAFERGGATEAGIVSVVQLLPAAVVAPFLGTLADRAAPTKVQTTAYVGQALAVAATAAVLLLDGPDVLAYALSAIATMAFTVSRPTQAVLTPALSRSPLELVAAMVTSGWIENSSVLVAPAIAGLILAVADVGTVYLVMAVLLAIGAIAIAPLRATDPDPRRSAADDLASSGLREVAEGFRTLRAHRPARLMVGFLGLEHVAWGAIDLLAVVLALDLLGLGASGAGYLEAAFGAGGLIGISAAVLLVGGRRLAPAVLGGALTWGGALIVLGVAPGTATAFALLVLAGGARAVLDMGARTLLLRASPPSVVSRVFGIAEGLAMLGLALGAVLVPVLVALGGPEAALIGVGLLVAGLAAVRFGAVLAVDEAAHVPVVELALLRRLPIFAPLPTSSLEALARALTHREAAAGTVVIREGDHGDWYFAIADGEVEVLKGQECVAVLGRGEGFGEIALLHEVPRTATVRARSDVLLYALEREAFLIALTGHEPTASVAHGIARDRRDRA
jgi:hypothetical protein